jgi:hypothetical protein
MRATALAIAAKAAKDPENSRWLLENARRVARLRGDQAFEEIAAVLATHSPDEAENVITSTITDPRRQGKALSRIVEIVAQYDIDRAERAAYTITEPIFKASALVTVASATRSHTGPG